MRTALSILTLACLAFVPIAGCNAPGSSTPAPVSGGKPSAPVDVTALVQGDRAEVAVDFRAAATSVDVRVSGTSGLTVTSPATVASGASFARGDSTRTVVTFTPPGGRADLVVTVAGVFDGRRGAKTVSFTVGEPTPAQLQEAGAGVTVDASGEKLILLPAERR